MVGLMMMKNDNGGSGDSGDDYVGGSGDIR